MRKSNLRKLFMLFSRISPQAQKFFTRWFYNDAARRNKHKKSIFLNYGYKDDSMLALNSNDKPNRLFIQLYQRAVQDINLEGKDIIEVGCGQGAGGIFLLDYKKPNSYTGVDLSDKSIEICKKNCHYDNATWLQGCASQLPVNSCSMDVLVNIESSHCYPSIKDFLKEAYRVLRPNGYMAFADMRISSHINFMKKDIQDSGFEIIQYSDITPQVLNSLAFMSDRVKAHINAAYPKVWRQAIYEESAIQNTVIYNTFITGEQKYLYFLLQKKSL